MRAGGGPGRGRDPIPDPDTVGEGLRRMGDPQQAGLQGLGPVRDLLSLRLLRHEGIGEYTRDADAMQIEGEKQEATWTYQRIHAPAGLSLRDAHLPSGGVSGRKCLSGLRTYRGCQARGLLSGGSDQRLGSRGGGLGHHRRSGSGGEGATRGAWVHTRARTDPAFRRVVKRELRRQPDLWGEPDLSWG